MKQTSWLEEHPASHSQLQDYKKDWMIHGVTCPSSIAECLSVSNQDGLSGKMSPVSCFPTKDGILEPSSGRWQNSGMGSPTECLTLNTSEWPKDADVCLLLDILETGDLPHRYYLSAKACAGILRRAEKRKEKLPELLKAVLRLVANQ